MIGLEIVNFLHVGPATSDLRTGLLSFASPCANFLNGLFSNGVSHIAQDYCLSALDSGEMSLE
jgi:hypothetical protein